MDVLADGGPSLAAAAATDPGRLRIAISTGLPPIGVKPDAEQLGAVDATASLLRELGHDVSVRELDWGMTMGNRILARFVRGIGDQALELGHRDRLRAAHVGWRASASRSRSRSRGPPARRPPRTPRS